MLIVPELKTVFIFVPRTGSGTLYREMMRVYPKSMLLYRHMEADGVPRGYDRWKRIGFVRHPACRLFSLYTYMRDFGGGRAQDQGGGGRAQDQGGGSSARVQGGGASADALRVRAQVHNKSFEEWLLTNHDPWTVPYDMSGEGNYWPVLARTTPAPENKLSQFSYLRPDLGTEVLHYTGLPCYMQRWGLDENYVKNRTGGKMPALSVAAWAHLKRYCSWDLDQECDQV